MAGRIPRAGLELVKGVIPRDKERRRFVRLTQDFRGNRLRAGDYLSRLKSAFGRGRYQRLLPILPSCVPEVYAEAISEALVDVENVQISKTLSWLLRHQARREGLTIDDEGFVPVPEVLAHPRIVEKDVNFDRLQIVVATDQKSRYCLRMSDDGENWKIRANQGHSMVLADLELTPVGVGELEECVHGTFNRAWQLIQRTGLSRMGRQHIHMCPGLPGPGTDVVSGFRPQTQLVIYIDIGAAMEAGIEFFRSANGVILSTGNDRGMIPKRFFGKVVDYKTGEEIPFERE